MLRTIGYLVRWTVKQPIATYKAEYFSSNSGANQWADKLIKGGFRGVTIEQTNVPY